MGAETNVQRVGMAQDAVRRSNLSVVLTHLHHSGPATRAELTSLTGLTRSTVGGLVAELRGAGLVTETASPSRGTPGRPSPRVDPAPDGATVLAVLIAVDSISVGVFSLGGAFRSLVREERPRGAISPGDTVETLERLARVQLADLPERSLKGIGVGVVGVVRREDGFVHRAPNLGWRDVPLAALIEERLKLARPVVVGNEADLGALAEHVRGAGVGSRNLLYLSGEVGVGGGIIANGSPLGGAHGYAGEVGHMTVNVNGRRCGCGAVGCWETEIGELALFERSGCESIDELLKAAGVDDPSTLEALGIMARWLGIGLAGLKNIFDAETIVLGGHFSQLFPFLTSGIEREIADRAIASDWAPAEICPAQLGADSPLVGAAELALSPFLEDPTSSILALTGSRDGDHP